jgi:hypothetical protein
VQLFGSTHARLVSAQPEAAATLGTLTFVARWVWEQRPHTYRGRYCSDNHPPRQCVTRADDDADRHDADRDVPEPIKASCGVKCTPTVGNPRFARKQPVHDRARHACKEYDPVGHCVLSGDGGSHDADRAEPPPAISQWQAEWTQPHATPIDWHFTQSTSAATYGAQRSHELLGIETNNARLPYARDARKCDAKSRIPPLPLLGAKVNPCVSARNRRTQGVRNNSRPAHGKRYPRGDLPS